MSFNNHVSSFTSEKQKKKTFVLPMSGENCAFGLKYGYCLGNLSSVQNVVNVTLYTAISFSQ